VRLVEQISRRRFLTGVSLLPLAAAVPRRVWQFSYSANAPLRALSTHQMAVVEAATARLIPGPSDDHAERGHPGAREAKVVRYIDTLLGALDPSPERVFAGGPFSGRHGGDDSFLHFLELDAVERAAWSARLKDLKQKYRAGVQALDSAAGGDFAAASAADQDAILARDPDGFMTLLMQHAIEGMYSAPEYGGNAELVGWKEIKFPGDTQPRGYHDDEVANSDGPDAYQPSAIVDGAIKLITSTAPPGA